MKDKILLAVCLAGLLPGVSQGGESNVYSSTDSAVSIALPGQWQSSTVSIQEKTFLQLTREENGVTLKVSVYMDKAGANGARASASGDALVVSEDAITLPTLSGTKRRLRVSTVAAPVEKYVVELTGPAGYVRVEMECPAGSFESYKAVFDEALASVKVE